jgi:NADH-quinone oxidoreductase subunit M
MTCEHLLLPLAIAVPFLAGLLLVCGSGLSTRVAHAIAWTGFFLPAAAAYYAWFIFSAQHGVVLSPYLFFDDFNTGLGRFGISLALGLNGVSLPLFVLAGTVGLAAGGYAMYSKVDRPNAYLGLLLFMVSGLMGVFASVNIFYFYFFHEFALIPTFILIGWWGGPGGRSAAMEMTIYLTLGAMLSLIGLIALYMVSDAPSFSLVDLGLWLRDNGLGAHTQYKIYALLLFGFGILVSLWPFHSWAPTGYAAAPAPAAMLHAGVLKKFGLYGLLQIAVPLLPLGAAHWGNTLAWLALGNLLIIGAVTIAQRDLKVMVGYSSVMHMGYVFLGIVCLSALGAGGAVVLMFAHGLSVAALFLLGDAIYNRTQTYDLNSMGGLCQKAPLLSGFFLAATLASLGLPGFANFWGEFTIFIALWQYHPWMVAAAALGVIISAIYGLRAVSKVFFGAPTPAFLPLFNQPLPDIRLHERLPAILLLGVLMFVGFWPAAITRGINAALPSIYGSQTAPVIAQNSPSCCDPLPAIASASAKPAAIAH